MVIRKAKETGDEFTYPTICGKKEQVPLPCISESGEKSFRCDSNQKCSWHAREKKKKVVGITGARWQTN